MSLIHIARALVAVSCLTLASFTDAQPKVTVTIDAGGRQGVAIPADFLGLSFEMQDVLPDANGNYKFSPDNKRLLATFKTLGIHNLRVGGNTADRPTVKIPSEKDLDQLFGFAEAADVKVIFTLRLRESTPSDAARVAKYVMDRHKDRVEYLAIGNEPNIYAKTYPEYRELVKQYIATVTAPDVAPPALFCGPSTTPGKAEWARDLARDFAPGGKLKLITQHSYPGGGGNRVSDPASARDNMLGRHWLELYQKMYDAFVPTVFENNLSYRIEETNSYFNGGAKDASDTFASSLWALDYLYWWAEHRAAGINFHTGDHVAAGEKNTPCRYASFWTTDSGYNVHPIGYAEKAFDLGSHGKLLKTSIKVSDDLNVTAYAVAGDDGKLYVTLINKEHGERGRAAPVTIRAGSFSNGEMMLLTAPNSDVAATSGVTLGGGTIGDDASWEGMWSAAPAPDEHGELQFELPPATAAILRLNSK